MAVLFVTIKLKCTDRHHYLVILHIHRTRTTYLNSQYSAIALQPKSAEIKKIISKTDKKLQYL